MKYQIKITITENGKDYCANITLNAQNKSEILAQVNALQTLSSKVKHDELISTVELIKKKPEIVPFIKNTMAEMEDKSDAAMIASAPKYISKFLKILK